MASDYISTVLILAVAKEQILQHFTGKYAQRTSDANTSIIITNTDDSPGPGVHALVYGNVRIEEFIFDLVEKEKGISLSPRTM